MIACKTVNGLRHAFVAMGALLLAGCAGVIPQSKPAPPVAPPPVDVGPSAERLPDADEDRHRIALLVPLSGSNGAVGQSLANATTMALLDTNTSNIRITTYDTADSPAAAASRAIADGNRLILGPLLSDDVDDVVGIARPARVPLVSFSNDTQAAGDGVYIMGQVPKQSIARTLGYAASKGVTSVAGLMPQGEYGKRAASALLDTSRDLDVRVTTIETYDRSDASIAAAAARVSADGTTGAVLVADATRMAVRAAPLLKAQQKDVRILGTELWSGEADVVRSAALRGAWFSALSDQRYRQFSQSYRTRFGNAPFRIATLGYDAVLLAINLARDWEFGEAFPIAELHDENGFVGLDGAFRFNRQGQVERMFEVREVTATGIQIVSPAPERF
ncbi:penicillin-binding protein activator [Croceicoccus sp. F390]|uniref:Penicillin-binding protein activator n=1 Tax=Croceicoccus esteveae TaxID=3075597 RepID=A0ABU2ZJH5_9SPHN|nr:penicillin-binding protein activator [Croceicoccus sp. F390]MDT0575552.1 penicillin-binding protein activator [Croceicoccus sp. F390]